MQRADSLGKTLMLGKIEGRRRSGWQRMRWPDGIRHSIYMSTGKTLALTEWTFVGKVVSLLFNMLSRLVIAFRPRSKCLLIFWCSQSVTVSIVSPSICHEVMGLNAMIFVFWMLSLKPAFSLSSFTFIMRLFSSSSPSAIMVVTSAYLRLLIFLPAILMSACASSSLGFWMMFSAYKLNKQGDNMQPWHTPFPIWNHSVVPCTVLTCFLTCIQISQEAGQVVWDSNLFQNFLQFIVIHTFKGLHRQCFSGTLLLFPWSSGCWQFDFWFLCLF